MDAANKSSIELARVSKNIFVLCCNLSFGTIMSLYEMQRVAMPLAIEISWELSGWTIVAIVFTITSVILGIIQLGWHHSIKGFFQGKKIISEKGVHKGVREIAQEIRSHHSDPYTNAITIDYIVGIDGGGYIIAWLLGQELGVKKEAPLPMTRTWGPHRVGSVEVDEEGLKHISHIAGARVLLVDDVSATAATLNKARDAIERFDPKPKTMVAVLVRGKDSELDKYEPKVEPQFYDFCAFKYKLRGNPGNAKLPWSTFGI